MKRSFLFSYLFLIVCCKDQQQKPLDFLEDINGKYYAFELNGLKIDTLGNVDFYEKEKFPKEKWFYKVVVTIKDNLISIEKSPVFFDSKGKIVYSASDGGFLSYSGKLVKIDDYYVANTKLYDCDYIGLSPWQEPPKIVKDGSGRNTNPREIFIPPDMSNYDTFVFKDGRTFFLMKGTIIKNYILRFDNKELWINNERFYRIK